MRELTAAPARGMGMSSLTVPCRLKPRIRTLLRSALQLRDRPDPHGCDDQLGDHPGRGPPTGAWQPHARAPGGQVTGGLGI